MTALAVAGVLLAVVAWFVADRRGQRRLEARQAAWEDRLERERKVATDRKAADLRLLEAARAETTAEKAAVEAARTEAATAKAALEAARAEAAAERAARTGVAAEATALAAAKAALEAQLREARAAASSGATSAGAAEAAAARLRGEVARLEGALATATDRARTLAQACLLDPDGPRAAPVYPGRPAPAELEDIARRARGLAFIDAVAIADAAGLPLGRGQGRDADELAALVPVAARAHRQLEPALGALTSVVVATEDARTVELRALPGWTGGAWLAALASAQRPPAAALDGATAFAHVLRGQAPERPAARTLTARGRLGAGARTQALTAEVEREAAALGCQLMAIVKGPQLLAGVVERGPGPSQLEQLVGAVHEVQRAARAVFHGPHIAQLELVFAGGLRVGLAAITGSARLGLLTLHTGGALEPLVVERVAGRLRRFLDDAAAGVEEAA